MAKAGMKQKLGGSSKDPKTVEPEKQSIDIFKVPTQDPTELINGPLRSADAAIFDRWMLRLTRRPVMTR